MSHRDMPTLSVVIPTYNESPDRLVATVGALDLALARSCWRQPELVIVDDGTSPPVEAPHMASAEVRLIRQENRGRFEARRAGLTTARGDYVLLLDSRVTLERDSLDWVAQRVLEGAMAWNGHCVTASVASPYARFWDIIVNAAWAEYLRDPQTTSFGLADYDRYPKGSGHFLAPRSWLLEALDGFDSRYADTSLASDDTHMLRSIAGRDRIHISPHFSSSYHGRESLPAFARHTFYRGTTFFDGHSRSGSRFRPVAFGALPASMAGAILALRRPVIGAGGLGVLGLVGACFARRQGRSARDAAWFAALLPPFAIVYSAGIWRGAMMAFRAYLGTSREPRR